MVCGRISSGGPETIEDIEADEVFKVIPCAGRAKYIFVFGVSLLA
jgi:hypothetical protein